MGQRAYSTGTRVNIGCAQPHQSPVGLPPGPQKFAPLEQAIAAYGAAIGWTPNGTLRRLRRRAARPTTRGHSLTPPPDSFWTRVVSPAYEQTKSLREQCPPHPREHPGGEFDVRQQAADGASRISAWSGATARHTVRRRVDRAHSPKPPRSIANARETRRCRDPVRASASGTETLTPKT